MKLDVKSVALQVALSVVASLAAAWLLRRVPALARITGRAECQCGGMSGSDGRLR